MYTRNRLNNHFNLCTYNANGHFRNQFVREIESKKYNWIIEPTKDVQWIMVVKANIRLCDEQGLEGNRCILSTAVHRSSQGKMATLQVAYFIYSLFTFWVKFKTYEQGNQRCHWVINPHAEVNGVLELWRLVIVGARQKHILETQLIHCSTNFLCTKWDPHYGVLGKGGGGSDKPDNTWKCGELIM